MASEFEAKAQAQAQAQARFPFLHCESHFSSLSRCFDWCNQLGQLRHTAELRNNPQWRVLPLARQVQQSSSSLQSHSNGFIHQSVHLTRRSSLSINWLRARPLAAILALKTAAILSKQTTGDAIRKAGQEISRPFDPVVGQSTTGSALLFALLERGRFNNFRCENSSRSKRKLARKRCQFGKTCAPIEGYKSSGAKLTEACV